MNEHEWLAEQFEAERPHHSVLWHRFVALSFRVARSNSSIAFYRSVVGFLSWLAGRNHSETCVGCIVSSTTDSRCSCNWYKSTSLRKATLKAARVRAASYLRR